MRPFLTLPLLVQTKTQTWTDNSKEYVVRELAIDPLCIESFHEEAQQRYMVLHATSGKSYMIDCSQQELLELLGDTYAPKSSQE